MDRQTIKQINVALIIECIMRFIAVDLRKEFGFRISNNNQGQLSGEFACEFTSTRFLQGKPLSCAQI